MSCTCVPAVGTAAIMFCTQYASLVATTMSSCTMVWFAPTVRATPPSRSVPTPYTNDPACVVVSNTLGAPVAALAPAEAPTPAAPTNATTVSV